MPHHPAKSIIVALMPRPDRAGSRKVGQERYANQKVQFGLLRPGCIGLIARPFLTPSGDLQLLIAFDDLYPTDGYPQVPAAPFWLI